MLVGLKSVSNKICLGLDESRIVFSIQSAVFVITTVGTRDMTIFLVIDRKEPIRVDFSKDPAEQCYQYLSLLTFGHRYTIRSILLLEFVYLSYKAEENSIEFSVIFASSRTTISLSLLYP